MPPPPSIVRSASQLRNTKRLQMNAPQYKGRLYYLLTPQQNTFWLTKVNKLRYNKQVVNTLGNTKTYLNLTENAQKLTKSPYRSINRAEPQVHTLSTNSGSISWQRSSSVALSGCHPVPLKLKGRGSFSLVRFFWRSKRNEQKLGRGAMAETWESCLIALQRRTGIIARLPDGERSCFVAHASLRAMTMVNEVINSPHTWQKTSFFFWLFTFYF